MAESDISTVSERIEIETSPLLVPYDLLAPDDRAANRSAAAQVVSGLASLGVTLVPSTELTRLAQDTLRDCLAQLDVYVEDVVGDADDSGEDDGTSDSDTSDDQRRVQFDQGMCGSVVAAREGLQLSVRHRRRSGALTTAAWFTPRFRRMDGCTLACSLVFRFDDTTGEACHVGVPGFALGRRTNPFREHRVA
jgi:hypothetical protein